MLVGSRICILSLREVLDFTGPILSLQVTFSLRLIKVGSFHFATWTWPTSRAILNFQIILVIVFWVQLGLRRERNFHLHVIEQVLWHELLHG